VPLSERGPSSVYVVAAFGFWLFLLSDIVIFAALFAAYAVLSGSVDHGPSGVDLFDKPHVLAETACLLASSFSCGLLMIGLERRSLASIYLWGAVTFALGCVFISLEGIEFSGLVARGAGPSRSAFLSSFFALVGTHGLHVTIGLVWLVIMLLQVRTLGLRQMVLRRMLCFSLFWHALDIVWIGVFTIVYLGAR